LPAEWRNIYRWLKQYVFNPPAGVTPKPASLAEDFTANRFTVLTSGFVITAAVALRMLLPSELSLAPLFVFGCVFPTLVINRRWGTMAALLCAVALSITKIHIHHAPIHMTSFLWNAAMRFLFFEFYVLLFDGLRIMARDSSGTDDSLPMSPPG